MPPLRERKVTIVTQPNSILERGDRYLRDVDECDRPWLYRGRAFLTAGVPLAAGTDAPIGECDSWRAMQAAVSRRSVDGVLMDGAEALAPEQALALFLDPLPQPGGAPRRIHPGLAADLCLLDRPGPGPVTNLPMYVLSPRSKTALSSIARRGHCGEWAA